MKSIKYNKSVKFACAKNAHAWTPLTLRHLPQPYAFKNGEIMKKILSAVVIALSLSGCAEPLSEDKSEFVGLWKSNQTSLLITQSGRLEYESQKGATKTSISMPIKKIDNSEIKAGFLFFSSSFKLQGNPKEENGMQVLSVDGEDLYKTDAQGRIPKATVVPPLDKIRALVTTELSLLSKGINEKDFTDYLENSALLLQSQFTNEKLLENYKPFIVQKINIHDWMVGDFSLTKEPGIDQDGVLTIYGKYPTSPNSLKFKLSYIYSHPDWKGLGGDVNINNK